MTTTGKPHVTGFYDPRTVSIQYVVTDPATKKCALIDPVLDYDEKSGSVKTENADRLLAFVAERGLSVEWILDTHPHADHFSAAQYLRSKTGAPTAIGERIVAVQNLWKDIYNWPDFVADGSQWDKLFAAGDEFTIGELQGRILFSPGHTLASITYVVGDAAFIHDTLFMPDSGTARCDFPGGSAATLYRSIRRLFDTLPEDTRVFVCHDYGPDGRAPACETSIGAQKRENIHVRDGIAETDFVATREARDATLAMPALIIPSVQVNIRAGALPDPHGNGIRYLDFPLDAL